MTCRGEDLCRRVGKRGRRISNRLVIIGIDLFLVGSPRNFGDVSSICLLCIREVCRRGNAWLSFRAKINGAWESAAVVLCRPLFPIGRSSRRNPFKIPPQDDKTVCRSSRRTCGAPQDDRRNPQDDGCIVIPSEEKRSVGIRCCCSLSAAISKRSILTSHLRCSSG